MSLKRKRDVADTSAAQVPFDTLLTGLKDSDVQRLQASANGILRLLSLLRKADPSVEAKKLEKHLSAQNGFPELKVALETIHQYDNPNALAMLYNLSSSILNLRAYSLLPAQQNLLQMLVESEGSLFAKALLPGKNELTVAAVRLLGVMLKDVREDGWAARATKLWDGIAGDGKSLCRLLNTKIKSESKQAKRSDIRSLTLSFLLPLLSPAAPTSLKADILTLKSLIPAITNLLPGDIPAIVDAVLETLYMGVYKDTRLSGNLKLTLIDNLTEPLLEISRRKPIEQTTEAEADPAISAQRFLLASVPIFSPSRDGKLKFNPKIQRKIFGTFLGKLKIVENEYEARLGLAIVKGMPELLAEFWPRFFSQLEPKATTKWIGAVSFATNVICLPATFSSTTSFSHILDCVFPPVFTKQWISKALQHDNALVAHLVALMVLSCVQKAGFIMRNLEDSSIKTRLQSSMSDRLPDVQILVALLTKAIKDDTDQKDEELFLGVQTILRLILAYHDFSTSLTSGLRFDFAKLAPRVLGTVNPSAMQAIAQTSFLQLVASSAAAASTSWSKGQGAEAPLSVLVQYSLHANIVSNRELAKQAIQRILADNLLFEYASTDEINLWLDSVSSRETVEFLIFCAQKAIAVPLRYIEQLDTDLKLPSNVAVSPLLAAWMEQIRYQANLDKRDEAKLHSLVGSTILIVLGYTTTLLDLEMGKALLESLKGLSLDQAQIDGLAAALEVVSGQGLKDINRLDHIPQGTTTGLLRALGQPTQLYDASDLSPSDRLLVARVCLLRLTTSASKASKQSFTSAVSSLPILQQLLRFENVVQSSSIVSALHNIFVESLTKAITFYPLLIRKLFTERFPTLQNIASSFCESGIASLERAVTSRRAALSDGLAPLVQYANHTQVLRLFRLVAPNTTDEAGGSMTTGCLAAFAARPERLNELTEDDFRTIIAVTPECGQLAVDSLLSGRLVASLPQGLPLHSKSPPNLTATLPKLSYNVVKEWLDEASKRPHVNNSKGLAASVYLYANMYDILEKAISQQISTSSDFAPTMPILLALLDHCEIKGQSVDQLHQVASPWISQLTSEVSDLDCDILSRLYRSCTIDNRDTIRSKLNRLVSSLTPEVVRPNIFGLVAQTCRDDQSDLQKNLLTQTLNKSLEILVRRFAEDDADSVAVVEMVQILTGLLEDLPMVVQLKDHLVEPVVTASVQRRFNVSSDLSLARLLLRVSTCSDLVCYQLCQAIFAHPLLAECTKNDGASRTSVIQLLAELIHKAELAEKRNPPAEQIIALYHASLSPADLLLKEILQRMEVSGSFSLKNVLSQCCIANSDEVTDDQLLVNLSPDLVYATCLLVMGTSPAHASPSGTTPYDPDFVLAGLVKYISQPNLDVKQFLQIVRNNVLGLAVCGLASRQRSFRLACDRALARVRNRLQGAEFVEQEELMLIFDHIQSLCQTERPLSSSNALFLAHCLRGVGNPSEAMFVATLRHLLQRPVLEDSDLPLFYQTLYAPSAEEAQEQRLWLLTWLRDGMCKADDWTSLRRRQTWELLTSLFQAGFTTQAERELVLQVLSKCALQDVAVSDMVRKNGLIQWLGNVDHTSTEESHLIVQILHRLTERLPFDKVPAAEVSVWWAGIPMVLGKHQGTTQRDQLRSIRRILVKMPSVSMDPSSCKRALNAIALCLGQVKLAGQLEQTDLDLLVPLHDCLLRLQYLCSVHRVEFGLVDKLEEIGGMLVAHSREIRSLNAQ